MIIYLPVTLLCLRWWIEPAVLAQLTPGSAGTTTFMLTTITSLGVIVSAWLMSPPRAHWLEGDTLVGRSGRRIERLPLADVEEVVPSYRGRTTSPIGVHGKGRQVDIPALPATRPLRIHLYRRLRTNRALTVRAGELARALCLDPDDPEVRGRRTTGSP